jgi:outer membrane protein
MLIHDLRAFRAFPRVVMMSAMLLCPPALSGAETLRDALIGAYTTSGLLEQNRALLRAADEDVAQAVAALRPILNWTAGVNYTNTDSRSVTTAPITVSRFGTEVTAAITLSSLLWDNGRSRLAVEAAKEAVLATRQQLISIEQQVFQRTVAAYFNVRSAAENVTLRQNNLRLITEELRAAQDRFDVGEVTRTDVAQAQARLAEARSGLAFAMGQLVQAQEEYESVVGRPPGQLAPPGGLPQIESSIPRAKDIAVRNHPDLKQVQHLVAAAEINVEAARRQTSPRVTLEGAIRNEDTSDSSDFTESASVGIQATGPIYQGGALASSTRTAIANRDAQRGNLHLVTRNIRQNVGVAYAQLRVAEAQLEATDEQIRAARIAFEGVREEATLGARTTLDVLNAEQALLDALDQRISAQADRYIAAYNVLASVGQLTASALNLGVQQYDPSEYYNLVRDAPTQWSEQGRKLDRVLRALQKD